MAKKYMSLERLQEYDALIKQEIADSVSGKANSSHSHAISDVTNLQSTLDAKATQSSLTSHTENSDIHVTTTNKSNWNSAYTHSTSAHAPSNAQVNVIETIKVNGTALTPSSKAVNITVPTTAAEIGAASSTHNHDSAYDTKGAAASALASAQTYADNAAATVKNDLLNGAGIAYDTLKELGDLIDDNKDAIDALEDIASGKADATHTHAIADVSGLQSALDGKAAASHGTHVTYDSTNKPKMDGTAAFGTSTSVARADHVHPTDTSRASQADLDALEEVVAGKAAASHTHTIANITNLQTTLDGKAASSHTHTASLATDTGTSAITLAHGGKYKLTAGGNSVIFTMPSDNNTTYSAGTGISLSGTTFSNSGVRSISTGSTNGTISVNTGGTTAEVAVKGLGGAAYTSIDSALSTTSTNPVRNSVVTSAINTATSAISANTNSISTHTSQISALQTAIEEFEEITSADVQALFA